MTRRLAIVYVALALVGGAAGGALSLVTPPGKHELPPCPPLGTHLVPWDESTPIVVAEDDFARGTYPIGRPFVVLRCHR